MMKRLALMALLVAAGFAQGAVSLKVQRIGIPGARSCDSGADKALKHLVTVAGDSKEGELLHLEVYYYGTTYSGESKTLNISISSETLSFPARAGCKTEILLQSPVPRLNEYKHKRSKDSAYGATITAVLIKVLRWNEPLKAWTDVATLKNKMQKDLLAFKPEIGRSFDQESGFKYEVKAPWQEETPVPPRVPEVDAKEFEFMGQRFGEVYDSETFNPEKKFRRFTYYSRKLTHTSKRMYEIELSFNANIESKEVRKEFMESEFAEVVKALESKYKVKAVMPSVRMLFCQRAEMKLPGVIIAVENFYSFMKLTVLSGKWKAYNDNEERNALRSGADNNSLDNNSL